MSGNEASETESAPHSGLLGLPGVLRIGAKQDGSQKLSGKITCMVMYDTFQIVISDESEIKQECADVYSLPEGKILVVYSLAYNAFCIYVTYVLL